ncbi:MAG TPA: type II secretion system protein [Candidatus Saccharimonadia bacterium]
MKQLTDKKGFTLIEIVIVLAIAALILVAIFIAVQGAQASRRDAERRSAAGAIGALVEESAGNHKGSYPAQTGGATSTTFVTAVEGRTQKPNGGDFAPITVASTTLACPATLARDAVTVQTTANRTWLVAVGLESGDVFCTDNL